MAQYCKRNATIGLFLAVTLAATVAGSEEKLPAVLEGTVLEAPLNFLHIGNSIIFNLAGGLFISIVFWLLMVEIPERKTRQLIRQELQLAYEDIRHGLRNVLLNASGSYNLEDYVSTKTPEGFAGYFDSPAPPGSPSQTRWDLVYTEIKKGEDTTRRVHGHFEALERAISHALARVPPHNSKAHKGLHNFVRFLMELRFACCPGRPLSESDARHLSLELWTMFVTDQSSSGPDPYAIPIWISEF